MADLVKASNIEAWKTGIGSLVSASEKSEGDLTSKPIQEKFIYTKIYQPTSKINTDGGLFEDIKLGEMYHQYGIIGKSMEFIPLVFFDSRAMWVKVDGDGNKRVKDCEAPDAFTPLTNKHAKNCGECANQRGSRNNPSKCTYTLNAVVVPPDLKGMMVLSFQRTTIRVGEEIKARASQFPNISQSVFTLKTSKDPKGGAHYIYVLEDQRVVPDDFAEALAPLKKKAVEMALAQRKRLYEMAEGNKKDSSDDSVSFSADASVEEDGEDLDAPDNIA